MRNSIFTAVLLGLVALSARASAPAFTQNDREIQFGTADLMLRFDARSGAWKSLTSKGIVLLDNAKANGKSVPFDLLLEGRKKLSERAGQRYRLLHAAPVGGNTVELTVDASGVIGKCRYTLDLAQRSVASDFELSLPENGGGKALKILGFQFPLPPAAFTQQSHYFCPGLFPRTGKVFQKDLRNGRTARNWRDPCPTILELAPNRTIMTLQDRTRSYSDIGQTMIRELDDAVQLTQETSSSGYLYPGKPWRIGDFYLLTFDRDSDGAMRGIHSWMKTRKMHVPSNRQESAKEMLLYSFHPGMPNHPMQDWGGFAPSTKQLARIGKLNCNTIWILPVESECPYIPDDFYRMAPGIGTEKEYQTLVDTAHKLGMKVLQDVVPHGGRNRCDRAKAHPDWLLRGEDQSIPRVRCFDYNNSHWQSYLKEVVRFYTQKYRLDGWRIDTAGFSMGPNWSPVLPYSRGSHAMGRGGLNMMTALRDGARQINPRALTIAECDGSIFGTTSDIVYDFPLCRQVFQKIREWSPEKFVRELSLWLYEQDQVELEDQIRLRYLDSHDEPRAELLYGPDALRAGFAMTSWIHGVPMIYKEMEDGHSEVFSRIWKIRKETPELFYGKADYQSCKATPGVFAWIRSTGALLSVPVVNFNYTATRAEVIVPKAAIPEKFRTATSAADLWNGKELAVTDLGAALRLELKLDAYGFTVLRFGGKASLEANAPKETAASPDAMLPVQIMRLTPEGAVVPFTPKRDGSMLSADLPPGNALVLRIARDGASDFCWEAKSACGTVRDRFRTRHPFYPSKLNNMYSLPAGHNVLFDSLRQPFGVTAETAQISLSSEKGRVTFGFPEEDRPAAVFLLDRLGDDHNAHLVMVKDLPDSPFRAKKGENQVRLRISSEKIEPTSTSSGDPRLTRIAGGWLFDNGKLQMRIANNGSLTQSLTRDTQDGAWQVLLNDLQIELKNGWINGSSAYSSQHEMECWQQLEKGADGALRLHFFGRPRGKSLFHRLPPNCLQYCLSYTLNDSASFGLTAGVRPVTAPEKETLYLGLTARSQSPGKLVAQIPSGTLLPDTMRIVEDNHSEVVFRQVQVRGANPASIAMRGNCFTLCWYDRAPAAAELGLWRLFSAVVGRPGNFAGAPTPWRNVPDRAATVVGNAGVLDPSFEAEAWGGFADAVQSFSFALPWQLTHKCTFSPEFPHTGKQAAKIVLHPSEDQRVVQSIVGKELKPGERWRLSCFVRPEKIDRARLALRLRTPGCVWPDGRTEQTLGIEGGTSKEYRLIALDFTVPANLRQMEIHIGGKASSGVLWVDDVTLSRIGKDAR
ncbi:MAG: alpha-amylase family glycosyl hydrolase [Victivallaceae bacterium]|nr:alpha-amylase family glycosyl hydrolase [Victivallaceae bacterium]